MWSVIDRIGYWIATKRTPAWQLRTGVALTLGGLALIPYVFFADEPPLIYLMSAAALVLGGLSVVVTAALAVHSDPNSHPSDLKP